MVNNFTLNLLKIKTTFAQTTSEIENYLTSNPTQEIEKGVLNAGGLPSNKRLVQSRYRYD